MDTNINISTIKKYFSLNEEKLICLTRNKIVTHSHFIINEASICHKISKIPYFSNFFSILEDHDTLNISKMNNNIIEKLNLVDNQKYYLFKYLDKDSTDLIDLIYNSKSVKKLIFDLINSFQHILTALCILNNNNICFFNISPNKIIYRSDLKHKPLLSDFKFSINVNKINYNYFLPFLNGLTDFTFQPFEIHILFYLTNNNMITISYSLIDEFCEIFVENLTILNLFSENYKNAYKANCIETMKKYINLTKRNIIDDILNRNNKWDVYGISMIYLQIFGCINQVFSQKKSFISKIASELSKNIHPDSNKRMTLNQTLDVFNKYLNEENNWKIINEFDNSKLKQLFDEFSK